MNHACAKHSQRLVAILCAAVVLTATSTFAQVSTPIPGATGTFDRDLVTGQVIVPDTIDPRLVLAGTLVPGINEDVCHYPSYTYAAGTEFHLRLYEYGGSLWAIANAYVPALAGEFVVDVPLRDGMDPSYSTSFIWGPYSYKLYVGYDPDISNSMCVRPITLPVATVLSAQFVGTTIVSAAESSWGSIKCLFR